MSLNGIWYNELGSVMTLRVNGSVVTGTYQTAVGDAEGVYDLVRRTVIDDSSSEVLGWVVVWQNQHGNSESVTAWSGEFQTVNGVPTIVATWLLTNETDPNDDWHSTIVGKDTFTNSRPSEEQIRNNFSKGDKVPFGSVK